MAIIATGSKTIIDLSDGKSLSAYLGSNQPRTQIHDVNANTYQPNWTTTAGKLVITPVVYANQTAIALTNAALSITWKRREGSGSEANLASGESTAVKALAEIMRLRQAACNSLLVNKDVNLPSSKMECFMQLVSNLHDNHHRALVFSQFTSHLALVRQRLDAEGVQYLYLDGATPAKERLRLVEEFQHGDMPLFLISLKAGGLGLNLTAADYVIHLDPWWNPAIEEPASDRAYRIGQQNPVTVYRLIARGTIEEKILCLHQTKRNMADALLEGSDMSAAMSREEMLALIKEQIGS